MHSETCCRCFFFYSQTLEHFKDEGMQLKLQVMLTIPVPPHKRTISAILYFTNIDKEAGDFGGVGFGIWGFLCV